VKLLRSEWTEEELKQLAAIAAAGGTPFRAAARLKRGMISCQIQARKMGVPFQHLKIRRKKIFWKNVRRLKKNCFVSERRGYFTHLLK
jgi:hypothetical protein